MHKPHVHKPRRTCRSPGARAPLSSSVKIACLRLKKRTSNLIKSSHKNTRKKLLNKENKRERDKEKEREGKEEEEERGRKGENKVKGKCTDKIKRDLGRDTSHVTFLT